MASTTSTDREVRMRRIQVLAGTILATMTLGACASTGELGATSGGDVAFVAPDVAVLESSLRREYFLPDLTAFVKSDLVTSIVEGRVVETDTRVLEPGTEVVTFVTLEVAGGKGEKPHQIVTRETGGTVTLEQVRAEFEGRVSEADLDRNANKVIEYRSEGWPVSQPGENVLVFLGGTQEDPGGFFTALKLLPDGKGTFEWPEGAPNPSWDATFTEDEIATLTLLK